MHVREGARACRLPSCERRDPAEGEAVVSTPREDGMGAEQYAKAQHIAREVLRRDLTDPLWPGLTESDWSLDAQAIARALLYVPAQLAGERDIEWESREGMVTVYDHEGRYLGCMGRESWNVLLAEEAALAAAPPAARTGEEAR